jgi:hypothetical protein
VPRQIRRPKRNNVTVNLPQSKAGIEAAALLIVPEFTHHLQFAAISVEG